MWSGAHAELARHSGTPAAASIRRYSLLRRPDLAAQRQALREAGTEDQDASDERWRLDAVQADTDGIRGVDLISFDAARAVILTREGCVRGWLSEQQLWDYVLDVARDVQRHFNPGPTTPPTSSCAGVDAGSSLPGARAQHPNYEPQIESGDEGRSFCKITLRRTPCSRTGLGVDLL